MIRSHLGSSLALALIVTLGSAADAAIPKNATQIKPTSLLDTKAALSKPLPERLASIRSQGVHGYRNLVALMFDDAASMDVRWKAVTAAARVGGVESKPELERALKSKEWFMRNAALVAMAPLDRKETVTWARKLLSDKALVVRMAAVDAIRKSRDTASVPLLWEKLDAKENFRGSHSLFIRHRIAETLAVMETPGREAKFVALLKDKDPSLHPFAISALERLTKQTFGKAGEPVQVKKAHWEKWWRDSQAM
ncbi:MAG TPA: HEAT repeat domain-containing protein [Bdellovibrionales bacterium]|nr:HEAT repeat domain-containing protein [Bdellovibrionales bacterium]